MGNSEKDYYDKIVPLLKEAGKIMLSASDPGGESHTHAKTGTANYVTDYDVAVQTFLIGKLREEFPGALFLAEERENDDLSRSERLVFVIDPIDGTTNFMHGCGISCISVAAVTAGKTVFGAVYDPYRDELFHAFRGNGAYLNGGRIRVSERPFESALVVFGTSPYYKDTLCRATFDTAEALFLSCADIRRTGSAALDLACLAAGRYDVFFECILQPWDIAAGILLVEEAGGIISATGGKKASPLSPSPVIAGTPRTYSYLAEIAGRYFPVSSST